MATATIDVRLSRATSLDAAVLAETETRSFQSGARDRDAGRPAGHGSPSWHKRMAEAAYYYKIMVGDLVVGGLIALRLDWNHFHIARIWVDPAHQRRGVGSRALALLEGRFPQATRWTADAPAWAHRRHRFLHRCGYRVTRRSADAVHFEKRRRGRFRFSSFGVGEPGQGMASSGSPTPSTHAGGSGVGAGYDAPPTVASTAAITSGDSGPASAAATHSRSSTRFFTPSTTVSTAGIDSA